MLRIAIDVFYFALIALMLLGVGAGVAMLIDAGTDLFLGQGRHPHPDAIAVIGAALTCGGALGVWWVRLTYTFFTMTRIR